MEFSFAFMCASFGFCFGIIFCRFSDLLFSKRAEEKKQHGLTLSEVIALIEFANKKEG